MYIFKNALRNIRRSKGRSILFGVIVFIIALAACLALSIRQAAETTRAEGLEKLSITANITLDMEKAMEGNNGERPDRSTMRKNMQNASLSLSEQKKYAKLSSVKSFYYTGSLSADASKIDAVTTDSGMGGSPGGADQESSGDFTITGFSSDEALTDFADGTASISSGKLFTEGTTAAECVISSTLATYNDLSVGDTITFKDSSDSSTKWKVKIVGIYKTSTSATAAAGQGMQRGSSANNIYMSYAALKKICSANDLTMQTQGTYTFASYSAYKKFKSQVSDAGLSDKYTVESQDINNYQRQLQPLTNLSKYAKYFLIVILAVGAAILIVLNIFNIRGRKYEIGVLAAIGMNKRKIARLFMYETAAIAICAIIAGGLIGSVISVPTTNALLASSASQQSSESFNRGGGPGGQGGAPQQNDSNTTQQDDDSSGTATTTDSTETAAETTVQTTSTSASSQTSLQEAASSNSNDSSASSSGGSTQKSGRPPMTDYISSVTSAANLKVILQLLVIGLGLILISGGASVAAVTRYDPLEILTNRD